MGLGGKLGQVRLGARGLNPTTSSTSQRTPKQASLHWITAFTSVWSLTEADNPYKDTVRASPLLLARSSFRTS